MTKQDTISLFENPYIKAGQNNIIERKVSQEQSKELEICTIRLTVSQKHQANTHAIYSGAMLGSLLAPGLLLQSL